jgi:HD-like signal output (HDOD) protein
MTDKENIQKIVNRLKDIPTLPQVVEKIIDIVDNPTTSASDLNKAISMDQALSAKILKLVNSAFYGFPKKIETLTQAIVILGFNTVRSLALSISMVDFFSGKGSKHRLNYPEFWRHSIGVSILARELAKKSFPAITEEAFVAGLLHDIGIIILDQFLPVEYARTFQMMRSDKILLYEAEQKTLGLTHADVGRMLAERWNLPDPLMYSISFHHDPSPARSYFPTTALIHAANIGAKILHLGSVGDEEFVRTMQISDEVSRFLRLSLDFPQDLREKGAKALDEGEAFISALLGS